VHQDYDGQNRGASPKARLAAERSANASASALWAEDLKAQDASQPQAKLGPGSDLLTTASATRRLGDEIAEARGTFNAHRGQLANRHTAKPQQIAAVRAVEGIIVTATRQQAGWAKLRLEALRELGLFLLRTPYLKGRPPKVSTADTLPSLEKLGITDRRIAWRAIQVARVDEDLFQRYLTSDEPTEKGLLRHALCESVPQDTPLHRQTRDNENYSQSENVVPFSTPTLAGRGAYWVATNGTEEWYTPPAIFRALDCRFDLDVASPGGDVTHWIPADRVFTPADNGLERDWGDAYVWMNPPFSRAGLPLWVEKFRQHANGICLIGDRTSTGWWQDLCGNADVILFVNKKINFISPTSGTGNNTLGSTLVAYGERAVQALTNAAAAGLGTLFKPSPSVSTSGNADLRSPQAAEAEENRHVEKERYWLTPPDIYRQLNVEFQFDFDACPWPRPEDFDSLEVPWGQSTYVNPPFRRKDGVNNQGPTAFVRKAIEQSKLGKTVVLMLPVPSYVNLLWEAGAELRSAGRVKWLEADTRQPLSSPSPITCFVLRGDRKF
jgi:phage N-6-adenine-methyltransferase